MIMQMKYCLPGVGATINHYPKAFVGDSLLLRQLCGHTKNLAHERSIARLKIQKRSDMFSWHDQDMNWRLRTDVLKSDDRWVFVNQFALDFPLYDATKETVLHRTSSRRSLSEHQDFPAACSLSLIVPARYWTGRKN